MKRILHILKANSRMPVEVLQRHAQGAKVEVILIQDATTMVITGVPVFVLEEDATEKTDYPLLSYGGMLEKIFAADSVVTW